MDDIKPAAPIAETKPAESKTAASGPRKYIWKGIKPKNPKRYNLYGALKLRPWSMTDAEIEDLLKTRPDLSGLWTVATT